MRQVTETGHKRRGGKTRGVDPSPSRLRYRMERLMLTPGFRLWLRVGVPCVLLGGGVAIWLADADRRAAIVDMVETVRAEIEARPEFTVRLMAVDGASPPVSALVREVLPVDFPISSFDLDLDRMREDVSALPPVKSAHLRIRQGGILQVEIEERVPVALWRGPDGLTLLDGEGVHIGMTEGRAAWPELPLITGEGADVAVGEALALFAAAGPLAKRLRGLTRVGERRWDVMLDDEQVILLPEQGAVAALERVLAMDAAIDLLGRDVAAVDLRIGRRPVLRLRDYASQELLKVKGLIGEDGTE